MGLGSVTESGVVSFSCSVWEGSEIVSELREEFSENFEPHLLQFAIFLIPIVGMLVKTEEVILSAESIKDEARKATTLSEANSRVKKRVRHLQVSDILFGIASGGEMFLALGMGLVSMQFLPFVLLSLVAKTALFMFKESGLYAGYEDYVQRNRVIEPPEKVRESTGELTRDDWVEGLIGGFLYLIPYLGAKVKYDNTLITRAEYIHPDCSKERRKQLEKIREVHRIVSMVARAISLTIIFGICSAARGHPLFLGIVVVAIVAASYFSGKVDMLEAYDNDLNDWKKLARERALVRVSGEQ